MTDTTSPSPTINLVDSHCHLDRLDLSAYNGQLSKALEAAHAQGITRLLCVAIDLNTLDNVLAIAQQYDFIDASVGLHPNEATDEEPTVEQLVSLADNPLVVAIGETGLDYFRTAEDKQANQQARFRRHIQAAKRIKKPLIIHTRQAREDTVRLLREEKASEVGGVIHCFTEDLTMAEQCMALGFYISFSGIVTFNNAKELQAVAKAVPLERLLIETDAPYLAPVPKRGKPNEPAYLAYTAQYLAGLKGVSLETLAHTTSENYVALFGAP